MEMQSLLWGTNWIFMYLGEICDLHVTFNISKVTEKQGFAVNRVRNENRPKTLQIR
jgi:hypothetical protein